MLFCCCVCKYQGVFAFGNDAFLAVKNGFEEDFLIQNRWGVAE